jgi:hypothetical protein
VAQKPKPRPPAKPKKPDKEKPQAKRFKETARQLGVDETGKTFEQAFRKLVPPKRKDRD